MSEAQGDPFPIDRDALNDEARRAIVGMPIHTSNHKCDKNCQGNDCLEIHTIARNPVRQVFCEKDSLSDVIEGGNNYSIMADWSLRKKRYVRIYASFPRLLQGPYVIYLDKSIISRVTR